MQNEYVLHPDDRGRWVVARSLGGEIVSSGSYGSYGEAMDELKGLLASEGREVIQVAPDGSAIGVTTRAIPRAGHDPDVVIQFVVPASLLALIQGMVPDAGRTNSEVLARAAILLNYALEVEKSGKRLAVIDDDLNVEREVMGIFPKDGR